MKLEKVLLNKKMSNIYRVEQSYEYVGDDYWDWSVWIESGSSENLDKIHSVTYHLHHTFLNPVRIIKDKRSKFRLETSGWGTFTIYVVINFKDKSVIELKHNLVLQYPSTPLRDTKKKVKKK